MSCCSWCEASDGKGGLDECSNPDCECHKDDGQENEITLGADSFLGKIMRFFGGV